jgi:CPA2 family monovalent cation:H+ antiporter-2
VLITVVSGPMLARLPGYAWFKGAVRRRMGVVRRPPEPLSAGN